MVASRVRLLSTLLLCIGCRYDFDELYAYELPDASVTQGDASVGEDSSVPLRSTHLIGLWGNHPNVDDECLRCAESACADVEAECRNDPECLAFTQCVAQAVDPAAQMACRASHVGWVTSGDVVKRDLNGPYGQCVFRDACVSQCEGAADLSCLSQYSWPTTPESHVTLNLVLNDSQNFQNPLVNAMVKACPDGDVLCTKPAAMGVSDASGKLELTLPTGFNRAFAGFLQLEGAGVYPTLIKFGWNLGAHTVQLVTPVHKETYDTYVGNFLKVELDPKRGMLQTRMLGCAGITTKGVRFATTGRDAKTKDVYIEGGLPSLTATETDALGSGGTFNVLSGYQTVTATRSSDEVVIGRVNAPVRPGFMTIVIFEPLSQ